MTDYLRDMGPMPGVLKPGNIDLFNRPKVKNKDGSISTVRSIIMGIPEGQLVLPTVVNGKIVSEEEAMKHFLKTRQHLGLFKDVKSADAFAEQLHNTQAGLYK